MARQELTSEALRKVLAFFASIRLDWQGLPRKNTLALNTLALNTIALNTLALNTLALNTLALNTLAFKHSFCQFVSYEEKSFITWHQDLVL